MYSAGQIHPVARSNLDQDNPQASRSSKHIVDCFYLTSLYSRNGEALTQIQFDF